MGWRPASGGGGGGSVNSVTGVAPIMVDNTDPANPVVHFGSAFVETVTGTAPVSVDNTNPAAPVVHVTGVLTSTHVDHFTAGAGQTVFNLSATPASGGTVLLFVNGVEYVNGVDFTVAVRYRDWETPLVS